MLADLSPECQEEDIEVKSFKAGLLLLYDILISKEVHRKKNVYAHSSGNRDGQDCLNFLFDLINDCAGYTEKYYEENFEKNTFEELVQKYRKEKEQHQENNYTSSELLGDMYPHCLLVIEGVEKLYRMGARYKDHDPDGNSDTLASDYLDTMILRLDVSESNKI